jgi:hypothetical protein
VAGELIVLVGLPAAIESSCVIFVELFVVLDVMGILLVEETLVVS